MLDGRHSFALRDVAQGTVDPGQAPAIHALAVAGLVEPVDGVWRLTQTGQAVLELEGHEDPRPDLWRKVRDWFMT